MAAAAGGGLLLLLLLLLLLVLLILRRRKAEAPKEEKGLGKEVTDVEAGKAEKQLVQEPEAAVAVKPNVPEPVLDESVVAVSFARTVEEHDDDKEVKVLTRGKVADRLKEIAKLKAKKGPSGQPSVPKRPAAENQDVSEPGPSMAPFAGVPIAGAAAPKKDQKSDSLDGHEIDAIIAAGVIPHDIAPVNFNMPPAATSTTQAVGNSYPVVTAAADPPPTKAVVVVDRDTRKSLMLEKRAAALRAQSVLRAHSAGTSPQGNHQQPPRDSKNALFIRVDPAAGSESSLSILSPEVNNRVTAPPGSARRMLPPIARIKGRLRGTSSPGNSDHDEQSPDHSGSSSLRQGQGLAGEGRGATRTAWGSHHSNNRIAPLPPSPPVDD